MNNGKEILYCFNRCVLLMYLSVYITPSHEKEEETTVRCSRMHDMAMSMIAVCYCFTLINVLFIIYYVYLLFSKMQPSIEIQLFIKFDIQDVLMFFLLSVNLITLPFLYDKTCGDFSSHMINILIIYWVLIFLSAIFGYFIYQKVFRRIEMQVNQQL